MMDQKTITVLGAGYVGLTTAALFAHAGYTVYAVEPNDERRQAIQSGKSFFYEAGLDPVIAAAIENGKLISTDSYEESIPKSTVVFSAIGTPDSPDGSLNLSYVFSAAKQAGELMTDDAILYKKVPYPSVQAKKFKTYSTANQIIFRTFQIPNSSVKVRRFMTHCIPIA